MLKKDNAVDKKRTFDKINSSQSNNNNNKYQDDKHSNNNCSNGNGNHSNNIGNHNKSNVVNNNNHNNNKRPEFARSIINRTGNKIHFPGTLKKKYCTNFADMQETCNRGNTCHFYHFLLPSGYHEDDIAPMVKFIDEHKYLVSTQMLQSQ